ncbi:MAG: putative membrane protein [Candidatus Thalassarchaeaceae archaeon]|jgi:uncharacterized membrane protein
MVNLSMMDYPFIWGPNNMLGEYGPLMIFGAMILIGLAIATPFGKNLNLKISETRRILLGLVIVETGALLTSMWTEIIHRQIQATGGTNYCAAEGIVQCGSVIGDPKYSEFLGFSWGMIGMISFSVLLYLGISLFFGPRDKLSKMWLDASFYMSLPGIVGVAWLVIVELFLVEGAPHICPYCTVVHIGMISVIGILYFLKKQHEEDLWDISAN